MKKLFAITALLTAATLLSCGAAMACGLEKGSTGTHSTGTTKGTAAEE